MKTDNNSYVGKECFFIDRVTHKKIFDGKSLGVCVDECISSLHKVPMVRFEKEFIGTIWQYKSDVRLYP